MDLVESCRGKLTYFRIKELKDVLTQLGLSKQGKKQDLVDRILAVLSDEQVSRIWAKKNAIGKNEIAKLVDDTYRKMQVSGATDLASKTQVMSDSSTVKIKGVPEDSYQLDMKVPCPCGSSSEMESLVKCEDPRCHVWQHIGCLVIPEKPVEGNPIVPDLFYCEICRLSRADPFWLTIAHPLFPVKLAITSIPTDGTNPVQSLEKTFQLTTADRDLLSKQEYDVQAWCMLLNDKVQFRMQWPQYADLQINGVPVRAINRPGSQLLGANGRDDGPIITPCTRDGPNKISLTACDARIFCLGVRLVKRRTVQQILNMIPKESDGEHFGDALARVRRCIGGGAAAENDDSDSDIEVVADLFTVNLRCPMSGSRMKTAGRFRPCIHMGCFDLDVFVELNQRSRKWQCPICLENYSLEHVIIDPYFNRITSKMRNCGEDTAEIEVKPDCSWRVKTKTENERRDLGDLVQWHSPDGALCPPESGEGKLGVEMSKQVKQEGVSEGHTGLKFGFRKNRNGLWEVSRPEDMNGNSGNGFPDKYEQRDGIIRMSSSATASGKDGEDASVNQDGSGGFDFTNNGIELDSMPLNIDSTYPYADQNPAAPAVNAEVIVLSDSDEENDVLISSSTAAYKDTRNGRVSFPMSTGMSHSYVEDPTLVGAGTSCLGLFNSNDDEFGMPLWTLPPGTQESAGFQLFNSDPDVSEALVDLQRVPVDCSGPVNCSTSMNGYALSQEVTMGSATLVPGSSVGHPEVDISEGMVDNPLFGGDDPSLQIFLPTRPSDASANSNLRDQDDLSNGIRTDDWISLTLGGGVSDVQGEQVNATNEFNSRQQAPSGEGAMESPSDHASLLLGMNSGRSEKLARERSDSPFSFPRQKRSVRPRLYLSIDSDSE